MTRAEASYELPGPVVDSRDAISLDVPCHVCGYNLRTLPRRGRCPECGTPVGESATVSLLQFAEPHFVRTLCRGAGQIIWGLVISIIAVYTLPWAKLPAQTQFLSAVALAAHVVMLRGIWLLAAREPGEVFEMQYGISRRFCRLALAIVALAICMTLSSPKLDESGILMSVSMSVWLLSLTIAFFAQFDYLTSLALRIPSEKLCTASRRLLWAVPLSLVAAPVLIGLIADRVSETAVPIAGAFGALVPAALYLTVIVNFRIRLGRLVKLAREQ